MENPWQKAMEARQRDIARKIMAAMPKVIQRIVEEIEQQQIEEIDSLWIDIGGEG